MRNNKLKLFISTILFLCSFYGFGQKPVIDSSVFGKWPTGLPWTKISNDGKYCCVAEGDSLVVLATDSKVKTIYNGIKYATFSANSDKILFLNSGDSMGVMPIAGGAARYIAGISWFQLSGFENSEYAAYLDNTQGKKLVIEDLKGTKLKDYKGVTDYRFAENGRLIYIVHNSLTGTGKEFVICDLVTLKENTFGDITSFQPSKDESVVLIRSNVRNDSNQVINQQVSWLNVKSGLVTNFWQGKKMPNAFIFDDSCRQVIFETDNSVYYYKEGIKSAIDLFDLPSPVSNYLFSNGLYFSRSGEKILFSTTVNTAVVSTKTKDSEFGSTNVSVWSYKSNKISRNLDLNRPDTNKHYFIINLKDNNRIVKIPEVIHSIVTPPSFENYLLSLKNEKNGEYSLNRISTADGISEMILKAVEYWAVTISPNGMYGIWFDTLRKCYVSCNINSKKVSNLSKDVNVYDKEAQKMGKHEIFGIDSWGAEGRYVYTWDAFDIWKMDMENKSAPVNLTKGAGRKNSISFSIIPYFDQGYGKNQITESETLYLSAFDNIHKLNGVWVLDQKNQNTLEKRNMDPSAFYIKRIGRSNNNVVYPHGQIPRKAKNANSYLIYRQSADNFPNCYFTNDFVNFQQITNVQPEKEYNWLTTELITWKMSDGQISQGILYKPENFDPSNKYPVIFDYYEKRSDELHKFILPEYSGGSINIPYYVSNGYLVFVPDLYYQSGHDGKRIVDAVESGANYLKHLPWIDSTKMGLTGHSYGGFETNLIITHSKRFAAACSAAGVSDMVSMYDQLTYSSNNFQFVYEESGYSNGSSYGKNVTPWTRPDLYIENSPVLFVGNITTPLLLMGGTKDGNVPFAQVQEFFMATRRAGKKVWFLQYNGAAHSVGKEDAVDFTIRMKQFFDHYLKGAPAPKWMEE